MRGMCLNWRVVAGLAAVGLAVAVAIPGAGAVAVPLLLAAACPLSMVVMMRGRAGVASCRTKDRQSQAAHTSRDERLTELESELAELRAAARRRADRA